MIEILNCDAETLIKSKTLDNKNICIVTDPPFNIKKQYKSYQDNLEDSKYYQWLSSILMYRNCPSVIIHYPESLHKLSIQMNKSPERVVSWVYNSNTPKQHRDIAFYGIKPDFKKVTQPYKNPHDKRIKERIAKGIRGGRLYDWWNVNQVKNVSKKEYNHPCIMPVEVMKNIIGILPKEYVIVDLFNGTGTTAIACKLLNRDFIGCDIEKEYCDIAMKRIRELL